MAIVSVVVSIYNTMQWLADCVESIRGQTLQDIEIILVDDGSTDYSGAICDAYAESDDRIRVIHQENKGVSAARNVGLDLAMGKYIMFCDSDDYVAPVWCEEMWLLAEKYPDAWICSGFCIEDYSGSHVVLYDKKHGYSVIQKGHYLQFYKSGLADDVWNKIYLKNIITKYGIRFQEDVMFGEDTLFVTDYWKKTKYGIVRNITPLYYYRRWSMNTLSNNIRGIRRFEYLTKKLDALKQFMNEDEKIEFLKKDYWRNIRSCLWQILSPDNRETDDRKIQDCKQMMRSPEFQEWYKVVAVEAGNNPWIEALGKMDFSYVYELLSNYYNALDYGGTEEYKYEN